MIIPIILLVLHQVFLAEETLANLWSFSSDYSYQSFKFPYVWTTVLGDYRWIFLVVYMHDVIFATEYLC